LFVLSVYLQVDKFSRFQIKSTDEFLEGNQDHILTYTLKNLGDFMNRVIIVLTILLGLSFAQQKQFVIQKQITSDTESDKNVNVQMNDDEITIKLNVDGEEQVFKANPKNEDEMKALEEMLAEKDVNLDLLHMDDDHRVWETMLTSGGYLGVKIDDITDQLRNYFNVKGDGGVLITEVMDDSPAEKSGLKAGDVIIKVNDQWIGDREELQETIRSFEPEEKVTVTTVRKGREKSFKRGPWGI